MVDAVVPEAHAGHENLTQDFPGGHVADEPHRTRAAKGAAHRAADLRRHALGDAYGAVLPRARQDDRFHKRAVTQAEQQFFRAVGRGLHRHHFGKHDFGDLGELGAELLGNVGHRVEGGGVLLPEPLPDLRGPEARLSELLHDEGFKFGKRQVQNIYHGQLRDLTGE